jgi:hypothetical protein
MHLLPRPRRCVPHAYIIYDCFVVMQHVPSWVALQGRSPASRSNVQPYSNANVTTPVYNGPSNAAAAAERRRSASHGAQGRQGTGLTEAAERELTFHPRITQLPQQYGNTAQRVLATIPFEERASAWARHREEGLARLAADAQARELEGCTFQPQLNPVSKVLSTQRGGNMSYIGGSGYESAVASSQDVHDRLYQSGSRGRTPARMDARFDSGSVSSAAAATRPRSQSSAMRYLAEGRPLFTSPSTGSPRAAGQGFTVLKRGEIEDGPLTEKERADLKECTFKPKVHTTYEARPIKSKYVTACAFHVKIGAECAYPDMSDVQVS